MKDIQYCNISENKEHIISIIKWLIEDVLSAGGDGDGIWCSKYYSIEDIKALIINEKLLPIGWWIQNRDANTFLIGEYQEWLMITNNLEIFNNRPIWQQVSLLY